MVSQAARLLIEHLGFSEDAIERLGGPLPWETTRIREGDYTPIVRRLEPAFEVGRSFVISTSYHRPQLVRDDRRRPTGAVIPAMRIPTLTITMLDLRRTARGLWSAPFNVDDRRHVVRRLRRLPPVLELDDVDPDRELTPEELELARVESAYGGSPRAVVDDQEGVEDDDLVRFTTEARGRDELREIIEHPERVAERDLLTKQNKLRKLQQEARRHRIDITPELDQAIAAVKAKITTSRRAA